MPDLFNHLLQLPDVAHHQHAGVALGDDARLGQRGQLARHLLAIGADLAGDVGMFGRGTDARLVVLDTCFSREPQQLGMNTILYAQRAEVDHPLR